MKCNRFLCLIYSKSPKVSESHSTKLQDHVEKNETDNITKSIKKKRINQN